jgi:putative glycosyltransferase
MKSEQNPTLSVVTSLYHSAPYIREFHTRIRASADALGVSREMIFVNDGETDNSIDVVRELIEEDGDVILVELSRNFGHHKALMTGIAHARGDFVFLIDADLEEDPAWLSTFWEILQAEPDLDVVYGIQRDRKGGLLERWCGWCFYKLFNRMSSIRVPENLVTARLMRSCYCRELLRFRERELFLGGILAATGFHQRAVPVRKDVSGRRRTRSFADLASSSTPSPHSPARPWCCSLRAVHWRRCLPSGPAFTSF